MFLRATTRRKDGKVHRYWSIVENRRLPGGRVLQRHLLYLGEINSSQERAWRKSVEVFDERTEQSRSLSLFPEDRIDAGVVDESVVRVCLAQLRLCRPRVWGSCWLALQLWEALELDRFWRARLPESRKGTRWDQVLFVLVAYRLLSPGSEWRLYRHWFEHSALRDLLGADDGLADIHTLYACHDKLLEHKTAVFDHLVQRWRDLFNVEFDVLLYDLTSTYFEANPPFAEDDKRRFGYSRDKRPDCVQVVIALVVTPEGLPLAYEVLPGNTADKTTLRDFLDRIERQYGKARRIWVMDRGIPTEETLAQMRAADPPVHYLVEAGEGLAAQALAGRPARRAGQALAAGRRAVRVRPERGSHRQGTGDAQAPTQAFMGAAQTALRHDAHAPGTTDEARCRTQPVSVRLAARRRAGPRSKPNVHLPPPA
jgi:hypothetical protein